MDIEKEETSQILKQLKKSFKDIDIFKDEVNEVSLQLYEDNKFSELLFVLDNILLNYNLADSDYIDICDTLIHYGLLINAFEVTKKYISEKELRLDVLSKKFYYKDSANLYKKVQNKELEKKYILLYLEENISSEDRYDYSKELFYLIQKSNDYSLLKKHLGFLIDYASTHYLEHELVMYKIEQIKLLFSENKNTKASELSSSLLEYDFLNKQETVQISGLYLKGLVILGDYKNALIVESKSHDLLLQVDSKIAYDYMFYAIDLYSKLNNNVAKQDSIKLQKTFLQEEVEEDIIVTEFYYTPLKESKKQVKNGISRVRQKPSTKIHVSEISAAYSNVEIALSSLLLKTKDFATSFQLYMNKLEDLFGINYALLYISSEKSYLYRNKRTIIKHINSNALKSSILNNVILTGESYVSYNLFSDNPYETIINNIFETTYVFTVPVIINESVAGAICYVSDKTFIDVPTNFEAINALTKALNVAVCSFLESSKIKSNSKLLSNVFNMLPTKTLNESRLEFNLVSQEKFNITSTLNLDDYYLLISNEDLIRYKNEFSKFLLEENKTLFIKYKLKSKISVFEIAVITNGVVESILIDCSKEEEKKANLENSLYINYESKLYSKYKLERDFNDNYKEKNSSYILMKIYDLVLYEKLYGVSFIKQLILLVSKIYKEEVSKYFTCNIYYINDSNAMIVLPECFDTRVIKSKINKVVKATIQKLHYINQRLNPTISYVIYKSTSKNEELDKIIDMLSIYLRTSNIDYSVSNAIVYSSATYNKIFYEEQLVCHISESLDDNSMKLYYRPIINKLNNKTNIIDLDYNLENMYISKTKIKSIVSDRHIEFRVFSEMLEKALNYLKQSNNKSKNNLLLMVDCSSVILNSDLIKLIDKFKNIYANELKQVIFNVGQLDMKNLDVLSAIREKNIKIATNNLTLIIQKEADVFYEITHCLSRETIFIISNALKMINSFGIINSKTNDFGIDNIFTVNTVDKYIELKLL